MSYKFLIVLLIVSVVGLFSVTADGEVSSVQKETPYFTNEDIEKYKKPSDSESQTPKIDKAAEKSSQKIKEEREKEYWCKKATQYKKKIERAQEEIAETEKELSGVNGIPLGYKEKKAIIKKLKNAKKQLKYAERDLGDLEDEAHSKGIPPGWLRCQFD